ncbi:DnaD domain protein [Virgibacillus necropolis]
MHYIDQYISLVQEFEQNLNRKLTNKEYDFIKWLIEQQNDSSEILQCS